jgi:hypothetical protein
VMCRIDVQFLVCRATSQPSLPTLVQGSLRSTRSFALNNASLSPISGASFAPASFACCDRVSQETGLRLATFPILLNVLDPSTDRSADRSPDY